MRTAYLQILPFLISLAVGGVLFFLAETQISHPSIHSLVMGTASGLIGIPIVFIFYDLINNFSNRRIRSEVANHIIFEMNTIIINMLKDLRCILGFDKKFNKDNLYPFLLEHKNLTDKSLHFTDEHAKNFIQHKDNIITMLLKSNKLNVVETGALQNILSISKEAGTIAAEIIKKDPNRKLILQSSLETLINDLDTWIEFCELDAIVNHYNFNILE